jgi:hypothetical protein
LAGDYTQPKIAKIYRQALGRAAGVPGIVYPSVRDAGNVSPRYARRCCTRAITRLTSNNWNG